MGIPNLFYTKKDGTAHWISDLRKLNKVVQQYIYPLPCIQDFLNCHSDSSFFSMLDVSMQYFTLELDDDSQKLCVISTTFFLKNSNVSQ
jgi:hypothetical protein